MEEFMRIFLNRVDNYSTNQCSRLKKNRRAIEELNRIF